jgi:hypothetical protein
MPEHFKERAKRILYTLYQKSNRELWEFNFGEGTVLDIIIPFQICLNKLFKHIV